MARSTIDLSGVDLDGLTVENFRERTGHRLRAFKEFASRVKAGEISQAEARQLTLDAIVANARGGSSNDTPAQPVVEESTTPDEAVSSLFED